MLHRLLMREWILTRRALLLIIGIYTFFQAYFVCRAGSAREWLVSAAVYASFLSLTLFIREDTFHAAAWSCTLPIRRQDLVQARFLAAWIMVAGALSLGLAMAGVMPGSRVVLFLAGHSNLLLDPDLWRARMAGFGAEERERLVRWAFGVMALRATVAVPLSAGLSVMFYEKRDL